MNKILIFSFSLVLFISNSIRLFAQNEYSTSINGTITKTNLNPEAKSESENGVYWCIYEIKEVTDEMRKLSNFKFYKDDNLVFTFNDVPGSDVDISDAGYIVFYDHSFHFNNKLKIHCYSNEGIKLFEKEYEGANLFGFSGSGKFFGVGSPNGIQIISLSDNSITNYPKGFQFAISEDDKTVAIASENKIEVFDGAVSRFKINTDNLYTRKLLISSNNNFVAAIDKKRLKVYSLTDGKIIFTNTLSTTQSFRDLKLIDNQIAAGVHNKSKTESRGEIFLFDLSGKIKSTISGESTTVKDFTSVPLKKINQNGYNQIPWPFTPFDSMRTVWNHYEQHMGGSGASYSYLHQGLDLITPIAEPVYAVKPGIVKCVLTLGGDIYWRLAISDTNVAEYSNGWLYAHLIQSSIQFDVGDTVQLHDYLGNIIEWTSQWGHIHFVEIRDSGFVWLYNDNEWGINFNPLLALIPVPDTTPPVIDNVFDFEMFGFCENETSNYLHPGDLSGDVDIIVKVFDYAGDSEWQQPAFKIDYWIKRISDDEIVLPRRMAHILNHTYPFYDGGHFEPFATVMYKRDQILTPSSWMETERNFHHVITNSDGDSIINLSEKNLALVTTDFYDSVYRIFVEAFDQSGNSSIDSMDVYFNNNISSVDDKNIPVEFSLSQNYPNPFNPSTTIKYAISTKQLVQLKVYDILGNVIATLVNEEKPAGTYEAKFDSNFGNIRNLASGIYFYRLQAGSFTETKKMVMLK